MGLKSNRRVQELRVDGEERQKREDRKGTGAGFIAKGCQMFRIG